MTYHDIDHGNYTKVYDRSHYSAYLPDSVDWRTSNAVTGVKNQVYLHFIADIDIYMQPQQ